jgi:Mg2+ and Co2+ transporter CorA
VVGRSGIPLDDFHKFESDPVSGSKKDEILERRRAFRRLDTVVDEHQALFDLLRIVHTPYLVLSSLAETFGLISRNTSFADRTVDRLEKHLGDLQQRYEANQQEKTNKRLAGLTVISGIFLRCSKFDPLNSRPQPIGRST